MPTEIMGTSRAAQQDEREVALENGDASDGDAVFDNVRPGISHGDYRVLVTTGALRSASGRGHQEPDTQDYARSKQAVDKLLLDRGLGIKIPSARPGRVTR